MKARVRKKNCHVFGVFPYFVFMSAGRSRCEKQESRIKDQYGKGYLAGGTEKNGYIFGEK